MLQFLLLSALLAGTSATPAPSATENSPEALLSHRALRRARLLIEMRMLQLRGERLECIRQVLLRRLPADLLPSPMPSHEPAPDCTEAAPLRR